jgi:hypothetical protein
MKKLNTLKIMALGLAACALASAAFAQLGGIYDLTLTYKYWADGAQKVQNYKGQYYYLIFKNSGECDNIVWYWRDWRVGSSAKYYRIGSAPYSLKLLGDAGKTVRFSRSDDWAMNGFGTARRDRNSQLSSLSVTGAFCCPKYYNGTARVRFNKSLTSKAAKNEISALDQVIAELERKGYEENTWW